MTVEKKTDEIFCKREPDKKQDTKNDIIEQDYSNNNNDVEFDDLLSSAGEFGLYQVLLFLSTCPFYMYGVFSYFAQLFITEVSPNHWCWIPELENLTEIERRNLAIPRDVKTRFGYSHCKAYIANWTDILLTGQKPNDTWETTTCQYGWEFNKTEIPYATISSEMEWVCEKDSYQATAQAIFFIGSIIGGLVIGWVADRFGRLPATVVSNVIGCLGGVVTIYARNFIEFAICRFFSGIAYDNCMMMMYLLVLEYVAPRYRTLISNISFALFYSVMVTALPWIVLACGHWKVITLATSLPLGVAIIAPLLIPESPRWLLSKGRIDDAVKKVLTIGRINKKEVPVKLIEQFKISISKKKEEEKGNLYEMLKRPLLRKSFFCICSMYICCALVFDGLVRSIGQLDFDFFVSFSVISATELPSMVTIAFIMDWMGRRWLAVISLATACLFSILTVFIGSGWPSIICAVIARFFVNMGYGTAMQWAAEILPVSARGSGAAVVHICGFIGSILAPYVVYLETYIYWLPLIIVGCVSGLATVIALHLPETARKDMPQSFEDAEELVRSQKFWDMPCFPGKLKNEDNKGHVNDCFEM